MKYILTKQEIIAKYKTRENFRQSALYAQQRENRLLDNFLKHLTFEMKVEPENTQFVLYWLRNHSRDEAVDILLQAEREGWLRAVFDYDTLKYRSSLRELVLKMYNTRAIKQEAFRRARTVKRREYVLTEEFENKEIKKQIKSYKYKPDYIKKKKPFRSYISRHLDLGKSRYEYVSLSDFDTPELKKERAKKQQATIDKIKSLRKKLKF